MGRVAAVELGGMTIRVAISEGEVDNIVARAQFKTGLPAETLPKVCPPPLALSRVLHWPAHQRPLRPPAAPPAPAADRRRPPLPRAEFCLAVAVAAAILASRSRDFSSRRRNSALRGVSSQLSLAQYEHFGSC